MRINAPAPISTMTQHQPKDEKSQKPEFDFCLSELSLPASLPSPPSSSSSCSVRGSSSVSDSVSERESLPVSVRMTVIDDVPDSVEVTDRVGVGGGVTVWDSVQDWVRDPLDWLGDFEVETEKDLVALMEFVGVGPGEIVAVAVGVTPEAESETDGELVAAVRDRLSLAVLVTDSLIVSEAVWIRVKLAVDDTDSLELLGEKLRDSVTLRVEEDVPVPVIVSLNVVEVETGMVAVTLSLPESDCVIDFETLLLREFDSDTLGTSVQDCDPERVSEKLCVAVSVLEPVSVFEPVPDTLLDFEVETVTVTDGVDDGDPVSDSEAVADGVRSLTVALRLTDPAV